MISIIGWIGAIAFIIAYVLLSLKVLRAESHLYHFLNALGGLCLVINALYLIDMPNLVVNMIWMGIALFSMGKIYIENKRKKTNKERLS